MGLDSLSVVSTRGVWLRREVLDWGRLLRIIVRLLYEVEP